jgi:hypothetical protein
MRNGRQRQPSSQDDVEASVTRKAGADIIIIIIITTMLSGYLLTTAWRVLGFADVGMASSYGG